MLTWRSSVSGRTYLDAMYPKVREGLRVVGLAVLVAIGVNQDGRRELLGLEIAAGERESCWVGFLLSANEN